MHAEVIGFERVEDALGLDRSRFPDDPHNTVRIAVGRDRRQPARIGEDKVPFRNWIGGELSVVHPISLGHIAGTDIVDLVLPVRALRPDAFVALARAAGGMHHIAQNLVVVGGVVSTHVVAVQQVNIARFPASKQQVRRPRRLIGNNRHATGTEVKIRSDEVILVERREGIDQRKAAVRRKLQDAVAVVRVREITIEGAIPGRNIDVAAGVRCRG